MMPEQQASANIFLWKDKLESVSKRAGEWFGPLRAVQLNWKPAPEQWSIGQCLDHLIVSNKTYFPILEQIGNGKYAMNFWQKNNPLSRYTGRKMAESLGPSVRKPFLAPKLFLPSKSSIRDSIVSDFQKHQEELEEKISRLEKIDLNRTIVSSPVASLVTFTLGNCLAIIAGHEERHLLQAQRILLHNNFPG